MKPLLIALLLFPFFALSQTKNDTKIIVIASDTANLFNRVALSLIDIGYSFELKDPILHFIRTTEKAVKRYGASSKINVLIKDSTVTITGLLRLDFSILGEKPTFDPVKYKTNNGNINSVVWGEMLNLAISFGNKITYAK